MADTVDLTALLGSRICHDLISPLGAIGNGLELFELSGQADGPEIDLMRDSVVNATARINLFRIAFGQAASGQVIGAEELSALMRAYYAAGRIDVRPELVAPVPRAAARLVLLAMLCLETALPLGGQITLRQGEDSWALIATGKRLAVEEGLWHAVAAAQPPAAPSPAQVQFALLADGFARHGAQPRVDRTEDSLTLRF